MRGQCRNCNKDIFPQDEDAGTYKEHFCSEACESSEYTPEISQWMEGLATKCKCCPICCDLPCDGCITTGICDQMCYCTDEDEHEMCFDGCEDEF